MRDSPYQTIPAATLKHRHAQFVDSRIYARQDQKAQRKELSVMKGSAAAKTTSKSVQALNPELPKAKIPEKHVSAHCRVFVLALCCGCAPRAYAIMFVALCCGAHRVHTRSCW